MMNKYWFNGFVEFISDWRDVPAKKRFLVGGIIAAVGAVGWIFLPDYWCGWAFLFLVAVSLVM
jgi:hypothetical protein